MGRKPHEINPECGKRLSEWLQEIDMKQTALAKKIHYTPEYISDVVRGKKNLSVELARLVSEEAPRPFFNVYGEVLGHERVRPQWLLCLDSFKTDEEWADYIQDRRERTFNSSWTVLDQSARRQGYKLLMNHPFKEPPNYLEMLNSQREHCKFVVYKDEETVKQFSVIEFIELTQRLERYADFLIWELLKKEGKHSS